MNSYTTNIWDANGWTKLSPNCNIIRRDWYQTLVTEINQCSAQVFKENMRSGANVIEIAPNLIPILDSLEYYNSDTKQLAGRYNTIINDDWVSAIKIYSKSNLSIYRTIGVIGLDKFLFGESTDIKILDFMYLLIQ